MGGGGVDESGSKYRGAQGLDPELIAKLEKQFGFDKPPLTRFLEMMWNYIRFDFGDSFSETLLSSISSSTKCLCRFRSASGF